MVTRRNLLAGLAASALAAPPKNLSMKTRLAQYATVRLEADLSRLTARERDMLPLLREAARIMDDLFWRQAYGDKSKLMASLPDPEMRRYAEINYGPWDRLDDNRPFVPGVGPKPKGAQFYPPDMTVEEFEAAAAGQPALKDLYTLVRRDPAGKLRAEPYHEAYTAPLRQAAEKLRAAAALAEDDGLRRYLNARAEALVTSRYQPSDFAWLDMKTNTLDLVIGPIETYEDRLFGYKAAFEAYVLIKDKEWSARLARYAALLPGLQKQLPVPEEYKRETPGSNSDLNAYDVLFCAGDCNAGSKTIAINLPNDEEVQLRKGARRLQLKNAMQAKFDRILVPIAERLIAPAQQRHVRFDAFFSNVMFHEVAHGLGIKQTLGGESVRKAMKDLASTLEEGKADVLGLFLVEALRRRGEFTGLSRLDFFVTFLAGILRSIRFGGSSAHGVANAICFRFFGETGAISRTGDGRYAVEEARMAEAVNQLAGRILRLQGDGNYAEASQFVISYSDIQDYLKQDLNLLAAAQIPVDIVFEQE